MILARQHIEHMLHFDRIPQGTFFSPHDDPELQRKAAIRWTIELGSKLAAEHPEIADIYRERKDQNTYLEIAQMYIPDIAAKYPVAASKAVGHAIRKLIPEDEQQELTALHRRGTLEEKVIGDRLSPEWRKIWKEACKRRHELYGTDVEAMVRGRGRVPWSIQEKENVLALAADRAYQKNGHPDYELIALELNISFHNCGEIRSAPTVNYQLVDHRRRERRKNG